MLETGDVLRATFTADFSAILENDDCRNAANAKSGGQFRVALGVDFG